MCTIASWNLSSYPFACVGVKVRTFRMPWNDDAPGMSSCVGSTEALGFSLMHSLDAILQKLWMRMRSMIAACTWRGPPYCIHHSYLKSQRVWSQLSQHTRDNTHTLAKRAKNVLRMLTSRVINTNCIPCALKRKGIIFWMDFFVLSKYIDIKHEYNNNIIHYNDRYITLIYSTPNDAHQWGKWPAPSCPLPILLWTHASKGLSHEG